MTMPHLMNCSHTGEGWCLDCVQKLGEENIRLQLALDKTKTKCQHKSLHQLACDELLRKSQQLLFSSITKDGYASVSERVFEELRRAVVFAETYLFTQNNEKEVKDD